MKVFGFFLILFSLGFSTANAGHPTSFNHAKKLLANEIYPDLNVSFYCGCEFSGKSLNPNSCGIKPRKNPKRSSRIEWEHVMPAWEVGHQRQCWQNGGRKNCNDVDELFVVMTSDLHNLVPASGELNGDRSNYKFSMIPGEQRAYGACDFEVDFKSRRAEPPSLIQGDIARIYFYMRDRYRIQISSQQLKLFEAWDRLDPVDEYELKVNERKTQIQGNSNCYVSKDCVIESVATGQRGEKIETPSASVDFEPAPSCNPSIKYCRQMNSCEQATFYLKFCGLYSLDKDGDGTPCESICKKY